MRDRPSMVRHPRTHRHPQNKRSGNRYRPVMSESDHGVPLVAAAIDSDEHFEHTIFMTCVTLVDGRRVLTLGMRRVLPVIPGRTRLTSRASDRHLPLSAVHRVPHGTERAKATPRPDAYGIRVPLAGPVLRTAIPTFSGEARPTAVHRFPHGTAGRSSPVRRATVSGAPPAWALNGPRRSYRPTPTAPSRSPTGSTDGISEASGSSEARSGACVSTAWAVVSLRS